MKTEFRVYTGSLRCAVTLLCGGLLMTPVISSKQAELDGATLNAMETPVKEWEQFQSFDTANGCEEMRLQMMRVWLKKENPRYVATFAYARCLPVDSLSVR
jgi:hypothetical protein